MAEGTHDIHQEYWRPLNAARNLTLDPVQHGGATCRCGTEYLLGARYCHVCGAEREPGTHWKTEQSHLVSWVGFETFRTITGLAALPLVVFLVGVLCALGALMAGWVPDGSTVREFQAAHLWRIELLLGAAVAFLGAIALKRDSN